MDKQQDTNKKGIPGGFPYSQMYTDVSKPADVANSDHKNVAPSFTAINSDGPWQVPAGKKGNGGFPNEMAKINAMANDHSAQVDAGKKGR